ncbi:MAG TPA: crosslink repair DNA glycosylase YcaQ family protein, partial [Steroidobacteraceae bacterium]|nr:crosslink repair DNA glycosylase YcaQ family protein [Steroidobacteraceae bacterium]
MTGRRRARSDRADRGDATPADTPLSLSEARRIALAAQGFATPRPRRSPVADDLVGMVRRLGLIQIDSVNVLVRSHYLPGFSRLGSYESSLLDGVAYANQGRALFEYWGHEASL